MYKFFSCLLCQTVSVLDVDLTRESNTTRVGQIQIVPVPQVVEVESGFTSKAEIATTVCGSQVISLPEAGGKEIEPVSHAATDDSGTVPVPEVGVIEAD